MTLDDVSTMFVNAACLAASRKYGVTISWTSEIREEMSMAPTDGERVVHITFDVHAPKGGPIASAGMVSSFITDQPLPDCVVFVRARDYDGTVANVSPPLRVRPTEVQQMINAKDDTRKLGDDAFAAMMRRMREKSTPGAGPLLPTEKTFGTVSMLDIEQHLYSLVGAEIDAYAQTLFPSIRRKEMTGVDGLTGEPIQVRDGDDTFRITIMRCVRDAFKKARRASAQQKYTGGMITRDELRSVLDDD